MSSTRDKSRFATLASLALWGACSSQATKPSAEAGTSFSLPDAGNTTCRGSATPAASATDGGDPLCTPDLPKVSYTNDVVPVFALCGGDVCHTPWSVATAVGQHSVECCDHRSLIEPGHPSASHIIQAVRGVGACVPQMPLDEGVLPQASITTLVAWVCQGATQD
jgi:hypothetical protein